MTGPKEEIEPGRWVDVDPAYIAAEQMREACAKIAKSFRGAKFAAREIEKQIYAIRALPASPGEGAE